MLRMSELESCFWMLLGKSLELDRGHSIGPIFRIFLGGSNVMRMSGNFEGFPVEFCTVWVPNITTTSAQKQLCSQVVPFLGPKVSIGIGYLPTYLSQKSIIHVGKYTLGIRSPSDNGNGTSIPCLGGDCTPQSSSNKVIGSHRDTIVP